MFNQRVGSQRTGVPYLHFMQLEMGGLGRKSVPAVDWPRGFKSVFKSIWGKNGKICNVVQRMMSLLRGVSLLPGSSMNGKCE